MRAAITPERNTIILSDPNIPIKRYHSVDAIKEKLHPKFENVTANDIKLWKVDISLEEPNEKLVTVNTKINVNIKEELGALKSRLRTCFTFPDGTEDEHIVINRECGGSEKEIVCLVDDEDLASVIWTQGFKPFSSWTFPQIKTLFGLTADSYIDLPRFDGELANTTDYEKILGHDLEDIAMKHKTCIHVTSANEATRREFISPILHGVAFCYDGEVKVCPEYELSGSHGKGPVNWVIKIGDTIIVVIEAKREDINQGVGQNAIQLQASSQRNKKKRTYNEALREDVMYGMVSTGVDWVIIKLVTTGEYNDSDNGNVEVLLSSRTPFTFPINESSIKALCLANQVVFNRQIESQESLKRRTSLCEIDHLKYAGKILAERLSVSGERSINMIANTNSLRSYGDGNHFLIQKIIFGAYNICGNDLLKP
ncbi:hypothetical protein GLOIN_2v1705536 [Rhizophagus clarus]|uniref:Crinkler effector protein N-terminal domain-containing protein n=1 Tax=Rhizophagus clarus TaxID=94130 RepID=A0A8H3R364_9GLOM|nr:hypothetical protein GLOIN_2v1705536 [Rhizophagus clarus]